MAMDQMLMHPEGELVSSSSFNYEGPAYGSDGKFPGSLNTGEVLLYVQPHVIISGVNWGQAAG